MATEYEWKFNANPALLEQINQAFPEEGMVISMETTYYDTPSASLSARHYTLRRRLENEKSVCTLKTPAGKARCEWEIACNDIAEAVKIFPTLGCPEDFAKLVEEGLVPVCGAKFTRIAKTLIFPEGTLELALDQGILTGGGKELPLCEVEVELKSGSGQFCDLFAKTLSTRFGLTRQKMSKFKRALALYKGE